MSRSGAGMQASPWGRGTPVSIGSCHRCGWKESVQRQPVVRMLQAGPGSRFRWLCASCESQADRRWKAGQKGVRVGLGRWPRPHRVGRLTLRSSLDRFNRGKRPQSPLT